MIDIVLLLAQIMPLVQPYISSPLDQSTGDTGFITINMRSKQNSWKFQSQKSSTDEGR